MKKRMVLLSLVWLLSLIKIGGVASATSPTEQIMALLEHSVQFGIPDESRIGRVGVNAPLRFQLDQTSITFIWDLDHPEKNRVYPISIEVVDPIQVPMIPSDRPITNQTQLEYLTANVRIQIVGQDLPHYLFVDEQGNVVMAAPNYAGNVPDHLWTGYVRRYLKTDGENPVVTHGVFKWDVNAANQVLAELNQIGQQFSPAQTYYRYDPEHLGDLLIVGKDWSTFMQEVTVNGQRVEIGVKDTQKAGYAYNILGVFSTYAPNQAATREIVYFLIEHQQQANVYVIDAIHTSNPTNLVFTQNQSIKQLLENYYTRCLVAASSEGVSDGREAGYTYTAYDYFESIPKRETDRIETIKAARIYAHIPGINFEDTPLEGVYKVKTNDSHRTDYVYFYDGLIYIMGDQEDGGVFVTYYPDGEYSHAELPLTKDYVDKVLAFIYGQ